MVDSRTTARNGHDPQVCGAISEMLARVGDKWSLLIASTLKVLERDGLVERTVTPTVPPQVSYALTGLGRDLLPPVLALAEWTAANTERIMAARASFDARTEAGAAIR